MSDLMKAQDAGHRERQALMRWWDVNGNGHPFWWYLERVMYNASRDEFELPNGTTIRVQDCPSASD